MKRVKLTGVKKAYADLWLPDEEEGEKLRELDYIGRYTSKEKAKKQVGDIRKYNAFTPARARELIETKGVLKVRVARENSPAMYFKTTEPKRLMKKADRNTKSGGYADEISIVKRKGKISIVRLWWD